MADFFHASQLPILLIMNCQELKKIASNGEDYSHQFKAAINSIDSLAVEIAAFANSDGGMLIVGIDNDGFFVGIERAEIEKLNMWISNATSQKIDPPVYVKTKNLTCDSKKIVVIEVQKGIAKPYAVNKSEYWVKNGADKRRATREELFRLMQASAQLHADEMLTNANVSNLDERLFDNYYKEAYEENVLEIGITKEKLFENLLLIKNDCLTLAGLLLFGKRVENIKPQFGIKATFFDKGDSYFDKEDIKGNLFEQYKKGISFVLRNIRKINKEKDFNAPGKPEIPVAVFKELIANALLHRDYFVDSPVFINIYSEYIEIASPGVLPNNVNIENIKYGIHIERNPILVSFMEKVKDFGYTGRGSGIPRVIRQCKESDVSIDFTNDTKKNVFSVQLRTLSR